MEPVEERRTGAVSVPTAVAYPLLIAMVIAFAGLFQKVSNLEQLESRVTKVEQKADYTDNRVTALQLDIITKLSRIESQLEIVVQKNDKTTTIRPAAGR